MSVNTSYSRRGFAKMTTGEFHLNFAGADSSPGLHSLVNDLAQTFGESNRGPEYALSPVEMSASLSCGIASVFDSLP
jgi:hypothetical protein